MEDSSESSSSIRLLRSRFFIEPRFLTRKEKICVPQVPSIRNQVMRDYHDSPCDRHPSMTETLELIKCHYWWLCIGKDVLMCLNAFLVRTLNLRESVI